MFFFCLFLVINKKGGSKKKEKNKVFVCTERFFCLCCLAPKAFEVINRGIPLQAPFLHRGRIRGNTLHHFMS